MHNATRNQLASGLTLFRSYYGFPLLSGFDSLAYRHSNPCFSHDHVFANSIQ